MRRSFVVVIILSLIACGSGKKEEPAPKPRPERAPAPVVVPEPEAAPQPASVKPGRVKVSDDGEINEAVTSMTRSGPGKKSMTVLRKRLTDAIPALILGMEHKMSNVRANSAQVLIYLHKEKKKRLSKEVVGAIIERLEREPDKDVRALIVKTLAKSKDTRFNDSFLNLLENDASADVRSNAAKGLGWNRAARAETALIKALSDENTWVRMEAATALRKLKARRAIPSLVLALSDSNAMVRDRVHKALQAITGKKRPADPSAWSSYGE